MNSVLAEDKESIQHILSRTKQLAENYFDKQDEMSPGKFIPDIQLENLPEKGIGALAVLDYFEKNFADKITNSAGPRYFGFVTGGSTPAAVAGDWLVSAYDQNACGSNDSIAPQLERQTIHFFKELFGLYDEYFGSFVTGATLSNFTGLAFARQWVGEQSGVDFSNDGMLKNVPVTILSASPHSSILKSLSMLGMGRNALVRIDTLPDREAIDVQSLSDYLKNIRSPVSWSLMPAR